MLSNIDNQYFCFTCKCNNFFEKNPQHIDDEKVHCFPKET